MLTLIAEDDSVDEIYENYCPTIMPGREG